VRRLGRFDEAIPILYSQGMATRDIRDHLLEVYGTEISHETVTDVVADEIRTCQNRPLDVA
jgi:putative transposase